MNKLIITIIIAFRSLISYAPTIPTVGETLTGTSFKTSFGGKGANQAVQCARMGVRTGIIATLGSDSYGDAYFSSLKQERIDVSQVKQVSDQSTGIASIWVDERGRNSIVIVPGANLAMSPEDAITRLDNIFLHSPSLGIILFQNEIDVGTNRTALEYARARGVLSIFNPAPYTPQCRDLLRLAKIICVNEVELQMMGGGAHAGANDLLSDSDITKACKVAFEDEDSYLERIIITLGAAGAAIVNRSDPTRIQRYAAPVVSAVDSVGAGDSFLGCLAAGLADGLSEDASIERAILCASYSVQREGAQPSYAYFKDL